MRWGHEIELNARYINPTNTEARKESPCAGAERGRGRQWIEDDGISSRGPFDLLGLWYGLGIPVLGSPGLGSPVCSIPERVSFRFPE